MTRTQSILTASLLALAALAPVLTAQALGSLETRTAISACLDDAPVVVAKLETKVEPNSCSANEGTEVQP
jgi:hypothetical protein